MYVIKALAEDFIVTETGSPQPSGSGPFAYFVLQKKDWTTLDALEAIGAKLGVGIERFGSAGNKDKKALTTQVCSVQGASGEQLERLTIKNITITYLGQAGRPVSLGTHEANAFIITVRNLDEQPTFKTTIINLFGDQRFSSHNAQIGRALVKRQFNVALDHLAHDATHAALLRDALAKQPKDTVGALRRLPNSLLSLFIHAYQSALWNAIAVELAERKAPAQDIPIVGFGTTQAEIDNLPFLKEQLKAEALTPRDFVIRQLPDLSAEGTTRALYTTARGLKVGPLTDDELHPGKKKVTVEFTLDKGSYATEFLKQSLGSLQEPS